MTVAVSLPDGYEPDTRAGPGQQNGVRRCVAPVVRNLQDLEATLEREGHAKPVCVAEMVARKHVHADPRLGAAASGPTR